MKKTKLPQVTLKQRDKDEVKKASNAGVHNALNKRSRDKTTPDPSGAWFKQVYPKPQTPRAYIEI